MSVVSQFFKHFAKVEKITIPWIALSDLRTTGPRHLARRLFVELCMETPVILASAPAVGTSAERLDLDTPAKSLIDPSD